MAKVAIIGAGHAGVEAAFLLANQGVEVTLWSNEAVLPYFRPRLIAVAFGQTAPEAIAIKPLAAYETAGIHLKHTAVTALDVTTRTVNGESFDGILLAQGAKPFVPPFQGDQTAVMTLWTMAEACRLREAIAPGKRITIAGGGVLGIEAALRAEMAGLQVTLVEVQPALMGGALGEAGHTALVCALEKKQIRLALGVAIEQVEKDALTFVDGTRLEHDFLLCATGARANLSLASALPTERGLLTDEYLRVAPGVYAAGDVAQPKGTVPTCSVRRAQLMAQCAAKNLLAELAQTPLAAWSAPRLPLFMKVEDVEFHLLGRVAKDAMLCERRMDDQASPFICQTLLLEGDVCRGIRSVGTRANVAQWEKEMRD
ncbi:MAG: FAD-dependent oxidoreductase [bacterium]|nr:FAD-dependent oxidoreductase [bacterium]